MLIPNYLIDKYVNLCGFEKCKKENGKFIFRCAVCGDSKTNRSKRRGYILYDQVTYRAPLYHCHNCGVNISFANYLNRYRPELYAEYRKELFDYTYGIKKDTPVFEPITQTVWEPPKHITDSILKSLIKVESSPKALKYCQERKLPKSFINELYYTENYTKYLLDNKLKILKENEYVPVSDERIVIPIYDKDRVLTHIQGRALYETPLRYITITIKEQYKIWGLDRVNYKNIVYGFEGIFDACFIPNSVAILGGQFNVKEFKQYCNVFCPDFDIYTNKQIRQKCLNWVEEHGKIFIPPNNLGVKDINDLILNGVPAEQIKKLIDDNTFEGLPALVRLNMMK